jgi:hypothetical protein
MTGKEIIASVLKRTGVSAEDFFGKSRPAYLTAARATAIRELTAAGLTVQAIARAMCRDHGTVIYWQSADFRAKRKAYYEARSAAQPAKVITGRVVKRLGLDARGQLLALYAEGRLDEVRALQLAHGVCDRYVEKLSSRLRRADCRRRGVPLPVTPRPKKRKPQKLSFSKAIAAGPVVAPRAEASVNVPPGAFDEARRRAAVRMSITSSFFGDPPPGYSALDRRNSKEARV